MVKKLECPSPNVLVDLIQGKMVEPELSALATHLEECPACQTTAKTLSPYDTFVESLRGEAPSVDKITKDVPPPLIERLKRIPNREVRGGSESDTVGISHGPDESGVEQEIDYLTPAQNANEIGWLGHYRILKVLGKGGMGAVFLAEDPKLDRRVALKVMLPKIAANPTAKERFLREARAAAKLKSDHIVTIYQVDEVNGIPYLAMELLEGQSLDDVLRARQSLSVAEIIHLARDIAKGLAAAHEKGLVHRDIKPGNLWVEQDAACGFAGAKPQAATRVKILDFGLAHAEKDDAHITQSGTIIGTPAYMAPEQARGEKAVDARADLFSLGCVLYRLCAGDIPFRAETTMGTLLALTMNDPVAPFKMNASIPLPLSELIMKLLEKDPARRPQTARDVISRLNEMERSPSGISVAVPTPRKRRPLVLATVALLFLALVGVAAAIFFWQTPDGKVVRIECNDPSIKIAFEFGELKVTGAYKEPVILKPGKAGLKVIRKREKEDDFEFETDKFIVNKGEKVVLKIVVESGKVQIVRDDKVIDEMTLSRAVKVPWLAADKLGPEAKRSVRGIEVRGKAGQATSVKILEIDNPPLTSHVYKMHGRIRYEKVEGVGHVEMWSQFADGQAYFTKTLAELGPMSKLQGTSDWRDLELPFMSKPGMLPKKLWVNVVLPGAGTVYLEPLKLSPVRNEIQGQGEDKTPPTDPDRKAAEWALSLGGPVVLNDQIHVTTATNLPKERFTLTHINLGSKTMFEEAGLANLKDLQGMRGLWLDRTSVTDAGLARLKDVKSLAHLNLSQTKVTDTGLSHFKGSQNLEYLWLSGTTVTDAGLAHLKDCKGLDRLWLDNTKVTDTGLAYLKGCKRLTLLHVKKTGVTARGLADFRAAVPGCKVEHDGDLPIEEHALSLNSGQGATVSAPLVQKMIESGEYTLEAYVKPSQIRYDVPTSVLSAFGHTALVLMPGDQGWSLTPFGKEGTKPIPAKLHEKVHVAGVVTHNQYKLFVNGKLTATLDVPANQRRQPTADLFMIGGRRGESKVTFLGLLDEIRVSKVARYDKAFTPDKRFEPDKDTLALYHCDEGQGDTLTDSSGNGHHGKVVGAKWVRTSGAVDRMGDR